MLVKGATGVYMLFVQFGWYRKARQSCPVIYISVTEQGHHWFKQRLVNYAAPITTLNITDSLSSERIRRTSIRNTHILFQEMHWKCRLHRTDHFVPASMSLCEEPNPVPDNRRLRLLSGEPDYFGRNKILSGYDLSHYQVPYCIRVFFYFVWFVFIHHNFQFYFKLCTYCNILDIYLS